MVVKKLKGIKKNWVEYKIPDNSDYVDLGTNQNVWWTKTFLNEPKLPNKTADATNDGTKPATESQVYKKQNKLESWVNIKTVNNESLLWEGNINVSGWWSDIVYVTQAEYNALPSSKLTDGKHYVIYKSDWWGWWQPWADTIAYYPLNSTYIDTDQSWNNRNGVTVWTLSYWNNYCQFSSWNYISIPTIIPYWANPYTISVWYNTSDSSWHQNVVYCQINSSIDNTGSALFVYQWHLYYCGKWNYDWDITDVSISNDTWYNIVFTYTWTQLECFVNGVSKWTFTRTISSTAPNIANIGKGSPEICIGKTSNLIIEGKVRTAQEIQDYFNQIKGEYWIS